MSDTSPLVSIVVPCFNSTARLGQLLDSIARQTYKHYEVICVNDGSTDGTGILLDKRAAESNRITVITQENAGPGVARNTGLAAASGKYVLFVDADDTLKPTLLRAAVARAEDRRADITIFQMLHEDAVTDNVYPSPDRWDPSGYSDVFSFADSPDTLFRDFRNWSPDKLYRRDFLLENDIEYPALYRTEDLPFTCKALVLAKRITLLDEELYVYHVNSAASSTATRDRHPLDFLEACKLFGSFMADNDLLEIAHKGYTGWIGLCVYVNLIELSTYDAFVAVFDALKDGGLAEIGLVDEPEEHFLAPEHYLLIHKILEGTREELLFDLWTEYRKLERAVWEANTEITHILESKRFRLGDALMKAPTKVRDRIHSRVI